MVFENLKKLSFLIVQSVLVVPSASYYQKEISGYLFTTSLDWRNQADAQNWCGTQNGSKLLAITSASIQNAVVAFINDAIQQNQLSGNIIITDGMRTIANWRWINGTSTTPLGIKGQEGGNALSYVYLYTETSGFSLHATQATDTNYYICEFAGQTSCVNGYQHQNQCFQSFVNETVTWFEARNRCLLRGGDLATFEFITTDDGLRNLNGSWINPLYKYWIGLRRQWWTWQSSNSDVTYSQWADGQPAYYFSNDNIDCLCLWSNDWKWRSWRCADPAQVVCTRASSSSSPSSSLRSSSGYSGVGLAIGLAIGIPFLVTTVILSFVVIRLKNKLRKSESKSSANNVGTTLPSAYESLQNRSTTTENSSTYQGLNTTTENNSTYQELNIA